MEHPKTYHRVMPGKIADRYEEIVWARTAAGLSFEGTARMFKIKPESLDRWLKKHGLERV